MYWCSSGCGLAFRWRHEQTSLCICLKSMLKIHSLVETAAAGKHRAQWLHRGNPSLIAESGWEKIWRSWPMRVKGTHLWWRLVVPVTALHASLSPPHSLPQTCPQQLSVMLLTVTLRIYLLTQCVVSSSTCSECYFGFLPVLSINVIDDTHLLFSRSCKVLSLPSVWTAELSRAEAVSVRPIAHAWSNQSLQKYLRGTSKLKLYMVCSNSYHSTENDLFRVTWGNNNCQILWH